MADKNSLMIVVYEKDEPTGARSVLDILEIAQPLATDPKSQASERRAILKQIGGYLDMIYAGQASDMTIEARAPRA